MSIDFIARIARPVMYRDFLERLQEVAAHLTGSPSPPMHISYDHEGRERLAPEDMIAAPGRLLFLRLDEREGGLSIGARTYSLGEPGVTESLEGTWMRASIGGLREPWQFVAGLAAVLAASELGEGRVVDENGFWSAGDEFDPQALLERVASRTSSPDFDSGAERFLERLQHGRDSAPD